MERSERLNPPAPMYGSPRRKTTGKYHSTERNGNDRQVSGFRVVYWLYLFIGLLVSLVLLDWFVTGFIGYWFIGMHNPIN